MMYAKKSLGQHFLHSEKALKSIRDAADPTALDLILEIGPGKGALTDHLLPLVGKIIAVEKDDQFFIDLQEKYKKEIENEKINFIHGDILEFDPSTLKFYKDHTYKLVANIPYNITGAIIRKFLSADYQPELMVLLVQKEVAERIVAKNKKESILSISVKAYGNPKYIETVKAGSFNPPPKVDSAIISIDNISKDFFEGFSEKDFFDLLHAGFGSKRKKLSGNLTKLFPKTKITEVFGNLGIDDNTRAEDVSIDTWKKITSNLLN